MDAGTVLVLTDPALPTTVDAVLAELTDTLDAAGQRWESVHADEIGGASPWARLCAEISRLDPSAPLSIVAPGASAASLPHVARAQHAAHRRVVEYVLVKPRLPSVTDTWPDAPVTVFCDPDDEASIPSRLRGWTVLPTADLVRWRPAE